MIGMLHAAALLTRGVLVYCSWHEGDAAWFPRLKKKKLIALYKLGCVSLTLQGLEYIVFMSLKNFLAGRITFII